ncbi:urease accessory protein F-like, partial [Limulus polyphemus]|uniref:Urease accessory protein F-like n=1 Tax=Limulus polyphemus TaxID=6850 RepID=A0ABM1S4V7_LIMPO
TAFPTGGFTHSLGCEAALQCGYITNKDNFRVFVISCLENAGSFSLPFVHEAHTLYLDHNALLHLDRLYNVSLVNHVARRASLQQGRSLLTTCCRTFLITHLETLQKYIDDGSIQGHQAVIFGAVCGVLKIPISEVLYMFMFGVLRTLVASIVRLGKIVGSLEGQRFQYEMQRIIPDIVARYVY